MAYAATGPRTRRRRAPTRGPIRWHRVGRLALLATLAAIVLLYIPPLVHWAQQHATASHAAGELRQLQREHQRLKSQLDALSTPAGIERAARRLGMVRQGERPYVVDGALPR
jgi:cell division protein FtsB